MKHHLVFLILFILIYFNALAQQPDAEGCNDSPFFKRMNYTFITSCSQDSDEMEFVIGADSIVRLNGIKTFISYGYEASKAKIAPSFFKIVKYYEAAVIKKAGKEMYYSSDSGTAVFTFKDSEKNYWLILDDGSGDGEGYYNLSLMEAPE